jgi:hypothetical protein
MLCSGRNSDTNFWAYNTRKQSDHITPLVFAREYSTYGVWMARASYFMGEHCKYVVSMHLSTSITFFLFLHSFAWIGIPNCPYHGCEANDCDFRGFRMKTAHSWYQNKKSSIRKTQRPLFSRSPLAVYQKHTCMSKPALCAELFSSCDHAFLYVIIQWTHGAWVRCWKRKY